MNVIIAPKKFSGMVRIPASKSHTIRQLLIASLADGVSEIHYPLDSLDTRSCVSVCKAFGAEITEYCAADPSSPNPPDENGEKLIRWKIKGNGNFSKEDRKKTLDSSELDVGNSGTTLYLALAIAGLQPSLIEFTGDEQIKRRSAALLLDALAGLGIFVKSENGCAPIQIKGPWKGGKVSLPCPTSQYLSALLIAAPLAPEGVVTEIEVPLLNEKPYVEMTLSYLQAQNIPYKVEFAEPESGKSSHFILRGGFSYKAINCSVPADFSSAAFPAAAAAITGGPVTLLGLDPADTQGDKYFLEILSEMGCKIDYPQINTDWKAAGKISSIMVSRLGPLKGGRFNLNATPDLLPAAAVVAAFAQGDTELVNVAHARLKETDRIAVMAQELAKIGVKCTELPDGLVVHGKGADNCSSLIKIEGHGDHRIVMAFACAALGGSAPIEITSAESAAVTYPGFLKLLT